MFDENENRDEITREEPEEKAEETVELSGEEDTAEKPEPEDIYSSSETNREYTNVYSSVADADDDDDIDIYSSDEPGVKYVDVEPDISETAYTDAYSQPVNTAQNYQQPQYAQNPYSPYTERAYAPPIYVQSVNNALGSRQLLESVTSHIISFRLTCPCLIEQIMIDRSLDDCH